jgi:hypothetical protein
MNPRTGGIACVLSSRVDKEHRLALLHPVPHFNQRLHPNCGVNGIGGPLAPTAEFQDREPYLLGVHPGHMTRSSRCDLLNDRSPGQQIGIACNRRITPLRGNPPLGSFKGPAAQDRITSKSQPSCMITCKAYSDKGFCRQVKDKFEEPDG